MTGADLKLVGHARRTSTRARGQPIVSMEFTGKGGDRFQDITRDEWLRGKLRNQPQHFAIVLDREIRSWPQIDFTDARSRAASAAVARRSPGSTTLGEAKDLALVLQTGALPVEFVTLDQTDISATLGKDSLQEAKIAAIVGLLARRALPAHLLPLPRARRRRSASPSTRRSCTRRSSSSTSR